MLCREKKPNARHWLVPQFSAAIDYLYIFFHRFCKCCAVGRLPKYFNVSIWFFFHSTVAFVLAMEFKYIFIYLYYYVCSMYSSLIQIIVISDFQCHCQLSLKRVNCVDIAVVDLHDTFHLIKEIISITHLFQSNQ